MEETTGQLFELHDERVIVSLLVRDNSHVRHGWLGQWLVCALCIHLERLTAAFWRLLDHDVLQVALVTLIPVDRVITRTRHHDVLRVYITTVKLDAVVRVVVDLQELNLSAVTNTI